LHTQSTQKFILKLFSEIMVKGSSGKRQMVGQLYTNLQTLLHTIDNTIKVKKFSDKLEVTTPLESVEEVRTLLLDTPGIEQVLDALQFDHTDTLDKIKERVGELFIEQLTNKRFVVRTKRSGSHPFTSEDISRQVGGYLLAHSNHAKVDLHHPEITVSLELINHQLNIITQKSLGLGGFPLGTQGDALSLISGGFDSTVSSYLGMKRGIKTHFLFFNLGGSAHEIGVKQVSYHLWKKYGASHNVTFTTIPFEGVVEELLTNTSDTYMGVMLKRLMLEAATEVADALGIDALITGESVAQVSSQTLRNLTLIDQATHKLVIRPLAMMDKPDIIALSKEIGTQKFAESMPEYCGVISKNPIIHGSFKRIVREDRHFNKEVLQKAIGSAQTLYIADVLESIAQTAPVEVVSVVPKDATIIDIRETDKTIESDNETLKIPFHQLKTHFKTLPHHKEYLLYCDKGILSRLHAQYLKDEMGLDIKVYRPV
jgi:thiamine biosynthesis protein ThiI